MDDLLADLRDFDAAAPLAAAPSPWEYLPTPSFREGPQYHMTEMIAAEPALAARIVARLVADGSAARLAAALRDAAAQDAPVTVTGCGTSEHAAMAVAAILTEGWWAAGLPGRPPVSAQAFELELDPPVGGLVIGISHEGGTGATIRAMAACRAKGAAVASITGTADSPAGQAADITLATVEMDQSWCHTVGYVSPMVAATAVAGLLAGGTPNGERPAARLRAGINGAHGSFSAHVRSDRVIGNAIADASTLVIVASGVDRITAREMALKVEEAAFTPAYTRDLETFLHGHLPATDDGTAVVFLLLERGSLAARAARMRQAMRAAMVVGIRPAAILGEAASALIPEELTPGGRIVVEDNPTMPNAIAALLGGAGPLQLVTLEAAIGMGNNPDPIRRDDETWLRAAEVADTPEA